MDEFENGETELSLSKDENYKLNTIISSMPGNVYWKDKDGKYLGCNSNFLKINKITQDKIIGKTDYDFLEKQKADKIREHDLVVINEEREIALEEEGIDFLGKKAIYLTRKIPLRDQKNQVIGLVGISMDVTQQKEAEKLQREHEEVKKQAEYNKQIAGSIAHDLRTPLASISSIAHGLRLFIDPLIDGYEKAKAANLEVKSIQRGKLAVLKNAVARELSEIQFANHYIDMMLGNLNQDTIKTDTYEELLFSQVLNEAVNSYPYRDDQRTLVRVETNVDFSVWGDAFYIKNIINNLLKNSFYFIAEVGKGEIYLWTETKRDWNLFHFKDTAKGASENICKNLFKSYFSARKGGTGLGLAFCKTMMESFGGDIQAESVEGEYMHFVLSFPMDYHKLKLTRA